MMLVVTSIPVVLSIPSKPGEELTSMTWGPSLLRRMSTPATCRWRACVARIANERSCLVSLTVSAVPPRMRAELFYWHRESRSSNAEVDYVIQRGSDIIPVEVKAGKKGRMRSMRMFLESHESSSYGIRTSLEPFSEYHDIRVVPLYALGPVAQAIQ